MTGLRWRSESRLSGKRALIVGGGSTVDQFEHPGTGAATAILMAAEGAKVAVMGRAAVNLDRTLKQIHSRGGEAIGVLGDATVAADCLSVVDTVTERFGYIDVLVNNLGLATPESVVEIDEHDWDRAMAVNLESPGPSGTSAGTAQRRSDD
jgi:NAD(P)-dependent dehydrogenase (short-subunit alcohol dehydrogenase family)